MKFPFLVLILGALVGPMCHPVNAIAQSGIVYQVVDVTPSVEQKPKFKLILFWRENDAATQAMTEGLKAALSTRSQRAGWEAVNVNDPQQRSVVETYNVSRAPMPLVLCVAPNGAVVGAIPRQISEDAVEQVLVTPAMAEATKALQEKRIVVIHIKRDVRQPLPAGAARFIADPMFKERTTQIDVVATDEQEARLMKDMEIIPNTVPDSILIVLAPPGVMVGKFPGNAGTEQIAAALHAAGKCCNDANCEHNQKGQ